MVDEQTTRVLRRVRVARYDIRRQVSATTSDEERKQRRLYEFTCPWYLLISSLSRACPKAYSDLPGGEPGDFAADASTPFAEVDVDVCSGDTLPSDRDAASATTGGSLSLFRSTRAGDGRASDAVDESIGVAVDDDTTAGTDGDLIIRARLAVRSATDCTIGSALGVVTAGFE